MQLSRGRLMTAGSGLILLLAGVAQILAAGQGLVHLTIPGRVPLEVIAPAEAAPGSRPVVLVGHGFAGSRLVMRGISYAVAHAGYVVAAWDFDGHGLSPYGIGAEPLLANAEAAQAQLAAQGWAAPPERTAILGHSMGTGAALLYGQAHPETGATIAISPVGQTVTVDLPRNLLLLAGRLEAPFLRNAEQRLEQAGGAGGDTALGTARRLTVIEGVEHVSILFAPQTHREIVNWLDAVFGPQPGARAYTDWRMLWYAVGLAGGLLLAAALAPLAGPLATAAASGRSLARRLAALCLGPLAATLLLRGVEALGVDLRGLFGVLMGGYLLLWYGLAGLIGLLLLYERPALPGRGEVAGGLMAFAALWLLVGLLGQLTWFPWLLIPRRLLLWLPGALAMLPWFYLAGQIAPDGRGGWALAGQWLAQSAALTASLFLAIRLSPGLGFLSLILPLFPVFIGLHALAAGPYRGRWPFALSGALFISWVVLGVFPLA